MTERKMTDMNFFPFTSWVYRDISVYPPTELDNQYEAGLNLPMTPPFEHNKAEDVARLKEYLDKAQEYGIQMILHADFTTHPFRDMGEERFVKEIKEFYEVTLQSHPAVYGFFVGDEPSTVEDLELTRRLIILMKKIFPNLTPYVNFQGATCSFGNNMFGGKTQTEWLAEIKAEAGYFLHSYDMYGQLVNDGGGTTDYFVECMKNLEASEKAGLTPMACLICSAHMVFHIPTEYDIVWQISTAAAMGFDGINWFRFYDSPVVPNYHGSPIDQFGNKTPHYYDMLRAIRGFQEQFGEIFPKLKRKSTYFFGQDRDRKSYPRFTKDSHDKIEYIRCFEESMLSFFEHVETGEEYFCIVNASRKFYDHYEIKCKSDDYDIRMITRNGLGNGKRRLIKEGEEPWEGEFLYPGQMGLFKIEKKQEC